MHYDEQHTTNQNSTQKIINRTGCWRDLITGNSEGEINGYDTQNELKSTDFSIENSFWLSNIRQRP